MGSLRLSPKKALVGPAQKMNQVRLLSLQLDRMFLFPPSALKNSSDFQEKVSASHGYRSGQIDTYPSAPLNNCFSNNRFHSFRNMCPNGYFFIGKSDPS